jgi:vancomycin resistance protein YoaR
MRFTCIFIVLLLTITSGCGYFAKENEESSFEKSVNASSDDSPAATAKASSVPAGKVMGSYTTEYKGAEKARAHNIELAASKLNQTKIGPGQTFSYNKSVGSMGKAAGFKLSRIFVKGKDAKGYGGGVCQVSSTLYNAALEAGLSIVERHPHSKPVGYVPNNKDATASYGGKDFKFRNDTASTLIINSHALDGKITVEIKSA